MNGKIANETSPTSSNFSLISAINIFVSVEPVKPMVLCINTTSNEEKKLLSLYAAKSFKILNFILDIIIQNTVNF